MPSHDNFQMKVCHVTQSWRIEPVGTLALTSPQAAHPTSVLVMQE